MREILFRGKPINKSECASSWIEGFYTKSPSGRTRILTTYNAKPIEVIPETVGQYRGIKDKNKKVVCDGDIVRYTKHIYADCSKTKLIKVEKPIIGEFYFAEGLWPGLRFGNGTGMLFLPGDLDSEIEFEVIGNVVDHPHLLKEGV